MILLRDLLEEFSTREEISQRGELYLPPYLKKNTHLYHNTSTYFAGSVFPNDTILFFKICASNVIFGLIKEHVDSLWLTKPFFC